MKCAFHLVHVAVQLDGDADLLLDRLAGAVPTCSSLRRSPISLGETSQIGWIQLAHASLHESLTLA
jgi:hypothetical protein